MEEGSNSVSGCGAMAKAFCWAILNWRSRARCRHCSSLLEEEPAVAGWAEEDGGTEAALEARDLDLVIFLTGTWTVTFGPSESSRSEDSTGSAIGDDTVETM